MLLDIFFLLLGLGLILAGASWLTDGASAIAKRMGISDLVVGLTVVAFGTSAPELVISVVSSIQGNAGLAIGNVVGSNIFNILAIVGITAMVKPVKIERSIMTNELPLVLLSSLVILIMGNGTTLNGVPSNDISRTDGLILLLFMAIFMRYTFSQAKTTSPADPVATNAASIPARNVWKAAGMVIAGLAMLVYGGDRFVAGASGIASGLGVSDAVIGLTVVAAGTSLPELATSITAALKGNTGIALGNVIGSCIFNVFFVLGCAATVRPLPFGAINDIDLLTLVGASMLFWIFGRFYKERTITRTEGAIMALCFIAYTTWLVVNA